MHTGLWPHGPILAMILILLETTSVITIIATALYAPETISDRAFRMLPWTKPLSRSPARRASADLPAERRRNRHVSAV
ncbi:hypothetical protein ACWDA3_49530 [Nonomuraea rubra]